VFESTARGSRAPWVLGALLLGGLGAGLLLGRAELLARISVLLDGGNPLAEVFAAERRDQMYAESPLAVSLELERGMASGEPERALAFADEIAREVGYWMLSATSAADLDEAERKLWADGKPDGVAVAFAKALQERQVHSHRARHLSEGLPPDARDPKYIHPDELPLLFLHVAWRLDLDARLVRSPVHLYVLLHEPGGERQRGVEPTCFRCVDALGKLAHSDELSVGRRLTFPPEHYPGGTGGIRNPVPLPPGAYEVVTPSALPGELYGQLAERHQVSLEALQQRLSEGADPQVARSLYKLALARGIEAWERGEPVQSYASTLASLRQQHGAALDRAPDERALEAAAAFASGDTAAGLGAVDAVLAHHEPDGAPLLFPRSDAHAMAMWLSLEHGRPTHEQWNARVVPLLNRYRDDKQRMTELCRIGRGVLSQTTSTIEQLVPECRGR
jgi:hypothetical protein